VLDRQRLGKQRVEVLTLLQTLVGDEPTGWEHHPAVEMWRGYPAALATYGLYICAEWRHRGYQDTCYDRTQAYWLAAPRYRRTQIQFPSWLGDEELHAAYRTLLCWKDPDHYCPIFEQDEPFEEPHIPWPKP